MPLFTGSFCVADGGVFGWAVGCGLGLTDGLIVGTGIFTGFGDGLTAGIAVGCATFALMFVGVALPIGVGAVFTFALSASV